MSSTPQSISSSSNRWWYVEKKDAAKKQNGSFVKPKPQKQSPDQVLCTKWLFKVFVNFDLLSNEKVSLTGACDQLGNWNPHESISLQRNDGENQFNLIFSLSNQSRYSTNI